jgi:hypothetical protein
MRGNDAVRLRKQLQSIDGLKQAIEPAKRGLGFVCGDEQGSFVGALNGERHPNNSPVESPPKRCFRSAVTDGLACFDLRDRGSNVAEQLDLLN